MRGLETALPPAFSLLRSEFNDFLFAPIGEESNDTILTVLSAFARLGVDPWQESARLAQLSKDMATQRLTSIVAGLPNGRWAQSDAGTIAARLIELLPAKHASGPLSRGPAHGKHPTSSPVMILLFAAFLGSWMVFAISSHRHPAANVDSPFSTTDSSPSAPLAGSK